jgi:hypothetical protein
MWLKYIYNLLRYCRQLPGGPGVRDVLRRVEISFSKGLPLLHRGYHYFYVTGRNCSAESEKKKELEVTKGVRKHLIGQFRRNQPPILGASRESRRQRFFS